MTKTTDVRAVRRCQRPPLDPIVESLNRADAALGPGPEADLSEAYWRELEGPLDGDPSTLHGLAWQIARVRAWVERMGGNAEQTPAVRQAWTRAEEELDRLARAVFRMGVEPTPALVAALPSSAYEVA